MQWLLVSSHWDFLSQPNCCYICLSLIKAPNITLYIIYMFLFHYKQDTLAERVCLLYTFSYEVSLLFLVSLTYIKASHWCNPIIFIGISLAEFRGKILNFAFHCKYVLGLSWQLSSLWLDDNVQDGAEIIGLLSASDWFRPASSTSWNIFKEPCKT